MRNHQIAIVLLAVLNAPGGEGASGGCQDECAFHAQKVLSCDAGRPAGEIAYMEHIRGERPYLDLAAEFVGRCNDTCRDAAAGRQSDFNVRLRTSSKLPLACRYDWTWCLGEGCVPQTPVIDHDAFLASRMCEAGRDPLCFRRISNGRLAGCAYLSPWTPKGSQDATWEGFACADGLVYGSGEVSWDQPEYDMSHRHYGRMTQGYRIGTWTEVLIVHPRLEGETGLETSTVKEYVIAPHGPYSRSTTSEAFVRDVERGMYEFGRKLA